MNERPIQVTVVEQRHYTVHCEICGRIKTDVQGIEVATRIRDEHVRRAHA